MPNARGSHPFAILSLILVNLIPIYGVLFQGWDIGMVLHLYWAETVIIGFYAILKLPFVAGWSSIALIPFFCVHFGLFMFVHAAFLGQFTSEEGMTFAPWDVIPKQLGALKPHWSFVLGAMFASHGISFVLNFLRGKEAQNLSTFDVMTRAYLRVVAMHVALIFGGFFVMTVGGASGVLVILVLIKIAFDLYAHTKEHRLAKLIERATNT